eukprot:scaffold220_cov169-Amphora_coffeaeformis.AAC.28
MKISLPFLALLAFRTKLSECLSISVQSRRELLRNVGGAFLAANAAAFLPFPHDAAWAAATPSPQELERLQKGHARVQYLLEHWDEVTKVCGRTIMTDTERKQVLRTNGGGGTDACTRNPLAVQDYLGYKSTADPLFKVDKLMVKAAPLAGDQMEEYLDVVEEYRENADATAVLAYTSSWAGEENPNGSAENIERYLEQTRDAAVRTEKLLRSCLKYLDLPVLPANAKP